MKRLTKILCIFVLTVMAFVIAGCGNDTFHTHAFPEWTIVEEPTFADTGFATRNCSCGQNQEKILPVLTDDTVWTKIDEKAATCTAEGTETYNSEYGQVEIVVAEIVPHPVGEWFISVEPTLTDKGTYRLECTTCEYAEEQEIPALTDETVWTKIEDVEAECDVEGYEIYESTYGQVKYSYGYLDHNYDEWIIVEKPNYDEGGKAEKTCPDCSDIAELVLPALTDTDYWTEGQTVDPNYNEDGYIPFTSDDLTFNYVLTKLVAPYDGKTYSSFAFDAEENDVQLNGVINVETAWSNAVLTLDNNGKGQANPYPFRGLNEFIMVDEKTGQITIKQTGYMTDEETGELVLDHTSVVSYNAYVDFETGIVVRAAHSSFNYLHVFTPFEIDVNPENAVASSWDNAMAINYTYNNDKYSIFAYNNVVYFGVKFVDETGFVINADECVSSNYVYVMDKDNQLLAQFVNNGEKLVIADGYQGTYVNGNDTLIVSGCGTLTLNDAAGTYTIATEEDNYNIEAYINNEFLEITLAQDTYTSNKPMVTITFDAGTYATVAEQSYNKNIVAQLPVPTTETQTFKGWFYDAELQNPVEAEFKPTTDCTLYAEWKPKVVINLVGTLANDTTTLYLGEGDVIGQFLPTYNLDLDNNKVFRGWFLDDEYNTALPEEAEVTVDDTNISIYAKWEDLPVYYGTYNGTEVYGKSNTSGTQYLTIDENGKITTNISRNNVNNSTVVSYDKATQKITYKKSNGSTDVFYFNEEINVVAVSYYGSDETSRDFYFLSKDMATSEKVEANYGVDAPKAPGSSVTNYYARFIKAKVTGGSQNVFVYNNFIYNNVTIKDALGKTLEISEINDSKSVVVYDKTGAMIIGLASQGESFGKESDTNVLDQYFGTYTNASETVILDGAGTVVYGEKTGTYSLALEGSEYQFDVYLENNTEYYQLTLTESNFTIVKPMVTVTVIVPEGHASIPAFEANINVLTTLPNGEEQGYVFNGYYLESTFETKVTDPNVFTKATNIYAKYSLPAVLTIVYNNTEADSEVVYSVGDIATVDLPVYAKHAFVGWYTTEEFVEGSEWTSGTAIDTDTTIYAKWEVAPIYNNTYAATEITGENENGNTSSLYTRTSAILNVDPYGKAASTGYPFNKGEVVISDYDAEAGTIKFMNGTVEYQGFIDANSGIIILPYTAGKPAGKVFFLNPFDTKSVNSTTMSSSYWNSGLTRAIEYTFDNQVYTVFINNGNVYFGVSFKDVEGNAVAGKDCYKAATLYVYDSEDQLIAKFGHNGTTMQELDGLEGTYVNATETLVLSGYGALTLNNVEGIYTIAAEDATYDLDVYVNNQYFEVTLGEGTYTVNKPMVTVTFDADDKATVEAVNTNKNVEIALPQPTNENYIFRGWYKEATLETLLENDYVPTGDVTLYAKWDVKVTLTVIYGNTLNDEVLEYGSGDTTAPIQPAFTNGKVFNGWYLDKTLTTEYTVGTITENTTIYCKWIDAVAMYGTYYGFNLYGSNKTTSSFSASLKVEADGSVTGTKTGTVSNYDPETGIFAIVNGSSSYYSVYDQASETIVFAYGSNATSYNNDLYLLFKEKPAKVEHSATLVSGKCARLVTITYKDGSVENLFLANEKIYSGVTWETDGTHTALNILNATTYTIFDKDGNTLLSK